MLRLLDLAFLGLIGAYFIVLLVTLFVRTCRGQPTGYDQISLLPESWRRWILDDKRK